MSQPPDQQPSPTKRPRSAQGKKHTPREHVAATDNKAAVQLAAPPGVPPKAQTSGPPIGEKWGEFPPVERQAELKRRLEAWGQEQDHEERPGPFAKLALTGADVYWLAALVRGKGDVAVGKKELAESFGDDLSNLHLEQANLRYAGLEEADLTRAHLEGANLFYAKLQKADLFGVQLEGADLTGAHLEGASLYNAHLEGASLVGTHLEEASLRGAHLEGANLRGAHLEGADLTRAGLTNRVNLQEATFDINTKLAELLGEAQIDATIEVADVLWNGVPLTRLAWGQVPRLGDEAFALQARWSDRDRKNTEQRLYDFEAAARAYRQLAIALRGQGITEAADRFTYRALIMQRKALWWQLRGRKFSMLGSYLFSLFLAVLTGYGFRMWRIIAAYTLLILAFAGAYWSLDLQTPHIYTFWQALILSVTAFHGRVFSNPFLLTEPQIAVTAIEAIFGLVIEGVFIAMLTQRFFNR